MTPSKTMLATLTVLAIPLVWETLGRADPYCNPPPPAGQCCPYAGPAAGVQEGQQMGEGLMCNFAASCDRVEGPYPYWCTSGHNYHRTTSSIQNDSGQTPTLTQTQPQGMEWAVDAIEIVKIITDFVSQEFAKGGWDLSKVLIKRLASREGHNTNAACSPTAPGSTWYATFAGCQDSEDRKDWPRVQDVLSVTCSLSCTYPGSCGGKTVIGDRTYRFPNTKKTIAGNCTDAKDPACSCLLSGNSGANATCGNIGAQSCLNWQKSIADQYCQDTAANTNGTCAACDACRAGGGTVTVDNESLETANPGVQIEMTRASAQRTFVSPPTCCDTDSASCAQVGFSK